MLKKLSSLFILGFVFVSTAYPQVENIPLDNEVYSYLKLLSVKKVIPSINDDDPNLSREQVVKFLLEAERKSSQLSRTEKDLLNKYLVEFDISRMNSSNTFVIVDPDGKYSNNPRDIFSPTKEKYVYIYNKDGNTIFAEYLTSLLLGAEFKPNRKASSSLWDFGGKFSGTFFDHMGYYFFVRKGVVSGNDSGLAVNVDPRLLYNFKFLENNPGDNERSFDFVNGYLKFHTKPQDDMDLSVQLGREKLLYGFSYTDPLVLGGAHPDMDFIKFKFDYGIAHYSSITASTVGPYSSNRDSNYTKFIALNRLKFSFPNLFDIGIGESVVYSRGLDIGYLTPVIFYKFVEHSLQDRDNGTLFFDFQTHFIKDLQFQGTFFMDENILGGFSSFDKQSNKVAIQFGSMWYEPVGLKDVSLTAQYTLIRPYVYTHFNPKNTYTSFGQILGDPVGPNADQIYTRLTYNYSHWLSLTLEYQRIRKGNNIYDAQGNLVKNVGGDVFQSFRPGIDSDIANFLDGERVNTDVAKVSLRVEPVRNFVFDFNYTYRKENNISTNVINDLSFGYVKLSIDY